MSNARNLADIVTGNFDVPLAALDNVPASNDASALTTGTLPLARIGTGTASGLSIGGNAATATSATTAGNGGVTSVNGATGAVTVSAAAINSWPVGSVFIAVIATNPNTLLGGGTWIAFGAGRVMVGLDASQTEFDVVEEVGGAKTHTLTTAQIPSHTHVLNLGVSTAGGLPFNGVNNGQSSTTTSSQSTGGGAAHNNLQPYIVCYFWKRTA
jgi:hypothetical protein